MAICDNGRDISDAVLSLQTHDYNFLNIPSAFFLNASVFLSSSCSRHNLSSFTTSGYSLVRLCNISVDTDLICGPTVGFVSRLNIRSMAMPLSCSGTPAMRQYFTNCCSKPGIAVSCRFAKANDNTLNSFPASAIPISLSSQANRCAVFFSVNNNGIRHSISTSCSAIILPQFLRSTPSLVASFASNSSYKLPVLYTTN